MLQDCSAYEMEIVLTDNKLFLYIKIYNWMSH